MAKKRVSKGGEGAAAAAPSPGRSPLVPGNELHAMGERACYLEFCPECDAQVTVADEECPDCGADLG